MLLIEGSANLAVLLAKLAVGISTSSIAVLGDAVHSFADLANNGLAFFAHRIASSPPDREHPYGHRKFETLAVFVLATLLAVLAIELVLHAVQRGNREVIRNDWGLAVMVGVFVVNVAIATWEGRWARRLDSDLLRADARHTLSDILVTAGVITGWQLASLGYAWLDTATTLGVAGLVLYLAYDLFQRAIPVLTDHMAADPEEIMALVCSIEGVREARRVRSKGAGGSVAVDVVVAVDAELSTSESHAIADAVEQRLLQRFGNADVTVHIEPLE